MHRRDLPLIAPAAALAAPVLGVPRIAAAQGAPGRRVTRFVPRADLALPDPNQSVAFATRNHAKSVCDTPYGWDVDWRG